MELYNEAVRRKCGLLTPKERAITGYRTEKQMKRDSLIKSITVQQMMRQVYVTKYLLEELPYSIQMPQVERTPSLLPSASTLPIDFDYPEPVDVEIPTDDKYESASEYYSDE